jgi:hypothetical protein
MSEAITFNLNGNHRIRGLNRLLLLAVDRDDEPDLF